VKLKQKAVELLSRYRVAAIVFVLYVILTIIFTYPVAFSANTFPGDGGDGYWFLWDLWTFKNAVFAHTNPLFTPYIFYPVGVSLVFSTTSFFNAALSIPLQLLWDLPHAYTFLWLMSFVLSGFGAFLLVRYLGVSTKVAFVCGLIFMFSSYRFAHGMAQLNMMTTEWTPFYALFFLKTLKAHKRSDPVIAGLFLSLAAFSDFYYVIYLIAFSFLAAAYYFWTEKQRASFRILKRIGLTFVVFGALVSPLLIPMLQELLHGSYMYSPYGWFFVYSADLVAFFIPSVYHPLLGPEVAPLYSHFVLANGGNLTEGTVFIGYVGLALSILAILKQRTNDVRFWAVASGVFLVLSLGPELHANGLVHVPSAVPYLFYNGTIHLPYAGLWHLPVFSIARVPSRWDVMVTLCVAVLSGFGLQYLVSRSQARARLGNVLCILCAGLILFEFLSVPYPTAPTAVPAFYENIASDPENYAIFEVAPRSTAQVMYYQTIHQKPLVNGYVSREPPGAQQFIETEPVARLLYHIQEIVPGNVSTNTTGLDPSVLSSYDIKYVIVHRENLTPQQVYLVNMLFKNASKGAPIVYEHGPMIVYATSAA
jgi:hypothetical protein